MASSVWLDLGDQGGPFSGQMLGPAADNTATPPYSFTGDTDTGYASSAANTLSLVAGGTTRLSITSTAVTSTVPFLGPDGTASAPGYAFATEAGLGTYRVASGFGGFAVGTAGIFGWTAAAATGIQINSLIPLSWSSGALNAVSDLYLTRDGAASLQMGLNAAGVTNQMLKGPDRITSDGVGGNLTIAGGRNRGASAGGSVIIQTSPAAGAGVTGTLATALTIDSTKTATFAGPMVTVAGGLTTIPLTITNGTNLTTATANAIENDGTAFYDTIDTTNGRRYAEAWNYFRLTGSGTGITSIADFFGATGSGIPLVANGVYEIHWHCEFSQATAGTATWTIVTATTALANVDAYYIGSNIAGIGTVGAPQYAGVKATASSSTALPVTGSEANAATHMFDIHAMVVAGNGSGNTRLRLTMSAGTATPLVNSYFKVRRLAAGNVGTFAT